MKYAIISDVHGNLPALNAILDDAKNKMADGFIFCGDYCLSNPFPDECIAKIKNIANAYVIRGNEESYLENLVGKDQSTWTDGQMQISYWCYQNVSTGNLNYLLSLPARLDITINNVPMHIAHSSAESISDCEHREWSTSKVAYRYKDEFVSRERFQNDIHNYLDNNKEFCNIFKSLTDGIYIFGHSHIQWSYKSEDGKKILINPGSCGLPLDCIADGIPYTIVDLTDRENVQIEEIRVPADKDEYMDILMQSSQFEKANVWSRIILKELKTCREHLFFFLKFVEEYAVRIGDKQRPYSVETWERAFELWEKQNKRNGFTKEI